MYINDSFMIKKINCWKSKQVKKDITNQVHNRNHQFPIARPKNLYSRPRDQLQL